MRHALDVLAEVAPDWLLEDMDAEWAERYQKRFSDFRLPKDAKERVTLAERIGADGRRLFERVYAETSLPWLRELDAVETLRRVWLQHYHASEFATPWRADGELPPSALLITSPRRTSKHGTVARRARALSGYKVHFTETCEADEPHLIVEVITTAATTPDGEIVGELHEQLAHQEMLPAQQRARYGIRGCGSACPESEPLSGGGRRSGHARSELANQGGHGL
jgi:transposase